MSLATNVSKTETGAVRSTDLATERWDLICWESVDELARAMTWFTDYELSVPQMIATSSRFIGKFLGGARGDTLARGWSYLAVAIQKLDCKSDLEYEHWVCNTKLRCEQPLGTADYSLVPYYALKRIATTCDEGCKKYGEHNWLRGFQVSSLLNHSIKHHQKWLNADMSEDHLGHCSWGYMASVHFMNTRPDLQKLLVGPGYKVTDELERYHAELACKREQLKAKEAEEAAKLAKAKDEAFSDYVALGGPVS